MDYATSSAASSVTTHSDYCQVTYLITFTHLSLPTYLGEDFFTVVGIPPTDTVTVSVTFDPNLSFLYPENYSGPEYVYEEYYTPWSNLVLSFGDVSFSAFPTDGNPYTSIRVRDGISDGSEDIGDAVILDAELTTLTPNGFEFTQALVVMFSFDETSFSGTSVPSPDVLNALQDGFFHLFIPVSYEGTHVMFFRAQTFEVTDVTSDLPCCGTDGGVWDIIWSGSDLDDSKSGGALNDILSGEGGGDVLKGKGGDDKLIGGEGSDVLKGGKGADCLKGDSGRDKLYAGKDSDTDIFIFCKTSDSMIGKGNRDEVYQFDSGEDLIDLYWIDANSTMLGDQEFDFSEDGPAANSVWVKDIGKHLLVRGDVDGDGQHDFEIQIMRTANLTQDDFIL